MLSLNYQRMESAIDEIVNDTNISSFHYKIVKTDLYFTIIGKH